MINTFERISKATNMVWHVAVLFTLTIGSASAQFVEFDPEEGLTGAVPASNTFEEGFFWDVKSSNLSRAGFEDGTVHPYAVYPWFESKIKGAEVHITEHAGHDTALKCYWSSESNYTHWEIRGFSKARYELWWSFDLYVPQVDPEDPDAPRFPDDRSTVISQIWHKGVGPMMVALMINQNHLKVMNHGGPSASVGEEIPRGEWNRVVLQVIPSLAGNGTYRLWYGGEKVIDKSGIRVAPAGAGEEDFTDDDTLVEGQYMDPWFGIYAQDPGSKEGKIDERTLFFDNVISYAARKKQTTLRVEAENFDTYQDESNDNKSGFYRPEAGVDIGLYMDDTPYEGFDWHPRQGNLIYYVDATTGTLERLQYEIDIPVAGAYRFHFRAASPNGSSRFAVSIDNDNAVHKELGVIDVPSTTREERRNPAEGYRIRGGVIPGVSDHASEWAFTTVRGPVVSLKPGEYTVTLDVKNNGGFHLDWWEAERKR